MQMPDSRFPRSPLVSPSALALLSRLNRYFLELLLADRSPGKAPLPLPVMEQLKAAGDSQRDAIAACSYSLFQLELPVGFQGTTDGVHDLSEGSCAGQPITGGWPVFATAAWFCAWHLSRANPLAVRMMLGLSSESASRLARLDPWQLHHLTGDQSGPLPPRWSGNPCFWPDLVCSVREADPARLFVAQLLGIQLLAAEMVGTGSA